MCYDTKTELAFFYFRKCIIVKILIQTFDYTKVAGGLKKHYRAWDGGWGEGCKTCSLSKLKLKINSENLVIIIL